MAGYDGYSRSNSAIQAEEEGKFPASRLAKIVKKYKQYKGCTAGDVKAVLKVDEWHHTSCKYNRTDYYNILDLLELDKRNRLSAEIADRKEYTKLYKLAVKSGVTHIMTDDGRPWYPIEKQWRGLFGANLPELEALRR